MFGLVVVVQETEVVSSVVIMVVGSVVVSVMVSVMVAGLSSVMEWTSNSIKIGRAHV